MQAGFWEWGNGVMGEALDGNSSPLKRDQACFSLSFCHERMQWEVYNLAEALTCTWPWWHPWSQIQSPQQWGIDLTLYIGYPASMATQAKQPVVVPKLGSRDGRLLASPQKHHSVTHHTRGSSFLACQVAYSCITGDCNTTLSTHVSKHSKGSAKS